MFYDFIATITAGFAMAGIALVIRHLVKLIIKKQLPKWLIPLFAFIGIMGFQIYQEYHWSEQKTTRVEEEGMQVVKVIEGSVWYRPWSYVKQQPLRLMAVNVTNIESNQLNPNLKRTTILVTDRFNGQIMAQAFDCASGKRADILGNQPLDWLDIDKNDSLFKAVCSDSHSAQ